MSSLLKLLPFVFVWSLALISAQSFNVTVNETDTSLITYGGGAADAPICKIDPNGTIVGDQPGCYNVYPDPPCTEFAAMGQRSSSFASWKFKGSALYITSLLGSISPLYTISIDGQPTDADGALIGRNSLAFNCYTLFSVENLDPNVEHTVNLTVKGISPNRKVAMESVDVEKGFVGPWSLIRYTYTTSNDSASASSTNTSSSSSSNQNSGNESRGQIPRIPEMTVLVSVLAIACYSFWA